MSRDDAPPDDPRDPDWDGLPLHRDWENWPAELKARYRWLLQARPDQLPPEGDWNVWLILAGRGWGKTRTGAEWLVDQARDRPRSRWAIVAPTFADGRDTCVEGESGLLFCLAYIYKTWNRSIGELVLNNGALLKVYSAEEPERLRGPQFHGAWCDELAAWNTAQEAWDQLQYGLRLGRQPQTVVTTTPRPIPIVRELLERADVIATRGNTFDNAENLAPSALEALERRYGGTRQGRQELYAEVLVDTPGALWTTEVLDALRVAKAPELERVVVAIDPAVSSHEDSDETGILIVGKGRDGEAYVLADRSGRYSPDGWARTAVESLAIHHGDRVVAEVNNGGDLVAHVLQTVDANTPYRAVRASRGKRIRAEPVAALYEQCVAGGSLIQTARGAVPVEQVTVADHVWTRRGLRRVRWAGKTGIKPTLTVQADGQELVCTADHPLFVVGRGFVHAADLVPTDRLLSCTCVHAERRLAEAEFGADRAPRANDGRPARQSASSSSSEVSAITTSPMAIGARLALLETNYSTARSGTTRTQAGSPPAGMSIIGTTIPVTMRWTTSSRCQAANTPATTGSPKSAKLSSGWRLARDNGGPNAWRPSMSVTGACGPSSLGQRAFDSARPPATRATGIISIEPGAPREVYNLTIDGEPEFFANGLLVHNCRVHHVGPAERLAELEKQMCNWTPEDTSSPDRLDALVWGLWEVMGLESLGPVFLGAA